MRPIVAVLIFVAFGIAAATAFLANRFLAEQEVKQQRVAEAPAPARTEQVLVASRDIRAGSVLVEDDFAYQEWPAGAVPQNLIVRGEGSDPKKEHVGAIAGRDFAANEPIPSAALLRQDQASLLTAMISPGMEAFTIAIDALSAVAGFVGPGDRVDILLTRTETVPSPAGERRLILAERILEDVRVLAINRRTDRSDKGGGSSATLEVTPQQAQMLAVATRMGELTLVLGSMIADGGTPLFGRSDTGEGNLIVTSFHVSKAFRRFNQEVARKLFPEFAEGEEVEAPVQPVVRRAPAPVRRDPAVEVTLYRGGVATTRTFVRSGN